MHQTQLRIPIPIGQSIGRVCKKTSPIKTRTDVGIDLYPADFLVIAWLHYECQTRSINFLPSVFDWEIPLLHRMSDGQINENRWPLTCLMSASQFFREPLISAFPFFRNWTPGNILYGMANCKNVLQFLLISAHDHIESSSISRHTHYLTRESVFPSLQCKPPQVISHVHWFSQMEPLAVWSTPILFSNKILHWLTDHTSTHVIIFLSIVTCWLLLDTTLSIVWQWRAM